MRIKVFRTYCSPKHLCTHFFDICFLKISFEAHDLSTEHTTSDKLLCCLLILMKLARIFAVLTFNNKFGSKNVFNICPSACQAMHLMIVVVVLLLTLAFWTFLSPSIPSQVFPFSNPIPSYQKPVVSNQPSGRCSRQNRLSG